MNDNDTKNFMNWVFGILVLTVFVIGMSTQSQLTEFTAGVTFVVMNLTRDWITSLFKPVR